MLAENVIALVALPEGGAPKDVDAFEIEALHRFKVDFALVPPRYRTSYFAHIWGNGYSAGYYAYLWSEVLAHDDARRVDPRVLQAQRELCRP